MEAHKLEQYVLCLTGGRNINKRMTLFIEGIRARNVSARILSLPRGEWQLDKAEQPLQPTAKHRILLDIGSVQKSGLNSVMCFHWILLPLAVFLGWINRVPILYDEHDHYELNTLEGHGSQLRRRSLRVLVRWIHRLCLPRVSLVTCIHMHDAVLKRHLEQWQSRVLEIHNYPAITWREHQQHDPPEHSISKLCFVYIGGVFWEKGPGVAAEAFQLLTPAERAGAELHIFGEGCRALIETLQQTSGVIVHNGVTPAEFRTFAARHRCCGLSLLSATPRYQLVGTNCTKLYEYLALGMPVIATRVGEFPEFISRHDIGHIIDGRMDKTELASTMRNVLADASAFARMSGNAIELMKRDEMTWESEWRRIESTGIFNPIRRAA